MSPGLVSVRTSGVIKHSGAELTSIRLNENQKRERPQLHGEAMSFLMYLIATTVLDMSTQASGNHGDHTWYEQYLAHIVAPGWLRRCQKHVSRPERGDEKKALCQNCELLLPQEMFSNSIWHHKRTRRVVCTKCQQESGGEEEALCQICERSLPKKMFTDSVWYHRRTRGVVCIKCQQEKAPGKTKCELCEELLPAAAYSESMWMNRTHTKQRTLCLDCCNPPCTRAGCSTCKSLSFLPSAFSCVHVQKCGGACLSGESSFQQ